MINYDLMSIRTVIFDIDGVLSAQTIPLYTTGDPLRTVNIRDGYAIQLAQKVGLHIAILTGAKTSNIRVRYGNLGVNDIFLGCSVKIETYDAFTRKYGYKDSEVMYMGDDIPDYEVMRRAGCPVCPADAAQDIKDISVYISDKRGGEGCGRDVIEQVLRAKGLWLSGAEAFGW